MTTEYKEETKEEKCMFCGEVHDKKEDTKLKPITTTKTGWNLIHLGSGTTDNSKFITLINDKYPEDTVLITAVLDYKGLGLDFHISYGNRILTSEFLNTHSEVVNEIADTITEIYQKAFQKAFNTVGVIFKRGKTDA